MTPALPEPILQDLQRYLGLSASDAELFTFEPHEDGMTMRCQEDASQSFFLPAPIALNKLSAQAKAMLAQQGQSFIALSAEWQLDARKRAISYISNGAYFSLTDKETALLQQLLAAAPNAISRAQLLEHVWHYDEQMDTRTLETHIYRLRQKLEAAGLAPCVSTHEDGYAWLVKAE